VGPQGAGKTHLAQAWAARSGAFIVGDGPIDLMDLPAGPVLLEDADRREADTVLFHLINRAAAGASLLLTAREAPRRWAAALPDLRSRLNALRTVSLGAPDDVVLERVLVKLFRDRNIKPDPEVLAYLLRRMERSVPAAQALVDRLDKAADTSGRGVTRVLAREVLEAGEQAGDKLGEPFE
jgi:chromosomal replication initiation ATPase DnaA